MQHALLLMLYIPTLTHGIELEVPQFLHNFYLSSTGYISINGIGLYSCARYCGINSGCKSFTYDKINQICRLLEDDAITEPTQFKENPGKVYGDRAAVVSDVSLMGACSDHDCPDYTTCVCLKSGSRVCVVSACGLTPGVSHSHADNVSTTMTLVGITRYLQCDTGYIGYKTVVCLANGNWSEPDDHCTDCGNPPGVSNAVVSSGTTTIGSNRIYECSPATTVSGSGDITCQQNGTWSESSLVCIPDCVIATNMQNAQTTATVAPAGTNIYYACDTGYTMTGGTGNRYCYPSGAWGALDITCTPVYCGDPPWPQGINGYSYSSYTYPNTVTYTCTDGLVTSPASRVITCQSDGQWSPILFQCV